MRRYLWVVLFNILSVHHAMAEAEKEQVIVVGAGVAGLTAASYLHEEGYEVLILEARDRIGGRVWTNRSLGVPLDMGASWIHGVKNNPIMDLAKQAKQKISERFDYDDVEVIGSDVEHQDEEKIAYLLEELEETVEWSLKHQPNDSLAAAVMQAQKRGGLNGVSPEELNFLLNTNIEHEFAADVEELSVSALDEGEEQRGGDVLLLEGYDGIFSALPEGLNIQTQAAATLIDYSRPRIKVFAGEREYEADRVIVTVPLGVLKNNGIAFVPELPAEKRTAIEALGMGLLGKVWLKFPKAFWHKEASLLQHFSNKKGYFAEWVNYYKYSGKPVLLAFNAGAYAKTLEGMSDAEITSEAMSVLRKAYGDEIPEPEAVLVSRWWQDKYARGSYSFLKAGATPADREVLAEPLKERLFFAGEATSSDYPATTQGAYLSGIREAERIMALD